MRKIVSAMLLLSITTACSMAPSYERPDTAATIPDQFPVDTPDGDRPVAELGWKDYFSDPQLQRLIELALYNNREFTVEQLETLAAQAQYGIVRADRLPTLNATTSRTRSRLPASATPLNEGYITDQYEVGLGIAAFELDFFGRVRSLSDSALAQFLASQEATRSLQITLVSEVARAYLAERTLAQQLELARQTLASREQGYQLSRERYEAGATSQLELRQNEVLLESARVAVPSLERQHAQARNALDFLVGLPVQLHQAASLAEMNISSDLPAGTPSELLIARPDIRAAEQQLISANANIGAARAAFFPRVSLVGSAGSASSEFSDLFESGTDVWSFVPQISLPLFTGGRNRANLDLAELRKDAAVARYEQAVQTAFREVADALVARDAIAEQFAAQERLYNAQVQRLDLAEQRFEAGAASYLEVLDTERELFEAEQQLVLARQLQLANAIDLYRALGGGLYRDSVASN